MNSHMLFFEQLNRIRGAIMKVLSQVLDILIKISELMILIIQIYKELA